MRAYGVIAALPPLMLFPDVKAVFLPMMLFLTMPMPQIANSPAFKIGQLLTICADGHRSAKIAAPRSLETVACRSRKKVIIKSFEDDKIVPICKPRLCDAKDGS